LRGRWWERFRVRSLGIRCLRRCRATSHEQREGQQRNLVEGSSHVSTYVGPNSRGSSSVRARSTISQLGRAAERRSPRPADGARVSTRPSRPAARGDGGPRSPDRLRTHEVEAHPCDQRWAGEAWMARGFHLFRGHCAISERCGTNRRAGRTGPSMGASDTSQARAASTTCLIADGATKWPRAIPQPRTATLSGMPTATFHRRLVSSSGKPHRLQG
jgi:hypothetical protein